MANIYQKPEKRLLRVFLYHASQDKPIVRALYQRLKAERWITPWLYENKLLPGQDWDLEIKKAVESADVVIVCLSNLSINKDGYVQEEIRRVLDASDHKPEGTILLIPLRLEDCDVPGRLNKWEWVDFFPKNNEDASYLRLVRSLLNRAAELKIQIDKLDANEVLIAIPKDLISLLPVSLLLKLDLILRSLPLFWEQNKLNHFVNHGMSYSERIFQIIYKLLGEIPDPYRLTIDEIYIVSACAYLYEIGMQRHAFKNPPLNFSANKDENLTFTQLEEIRGKKHLLSQQMIMEYLKSPNKADVELGIADDEYAPIIANICGFCSEKVDLDDVPELGYIFGRHVRIRSMVALLQLAERVSNASSRVNLDLLEAAWKERALSIDDYVYWWVSHYVSVLPIKQGQLRFNYYLPHKQKDYLGYVRAVIELPFGQANDAVIQHLAIAFNLYLKVGDPVISRFETGPFQRLMTEEILDYLVREVKPLRTTTTLQER